MLSTEEENKENFVSRVSFKCRRSVSSSISPFFILDGFSSRKSFSYNQLPQGPLNLTVLKLDGSSFDIKVMNGATVLELRQAVENAFSHMPKEGPGKVSWPHVWSHFCLSYEGEKLVRETEYIKDYGMKDGDQLHFIRHISVCSYNAVIKRRPKKQSSLKQLTVSSSSSEEGRERKDDCYRSSPSSTEGMEWKDEEESDHDHNVDIENQLCDDKEDNSIRQSTPGLGYFLRGWLSYSRLLPAESSESDGNASPLRFADGLCSKVRKFMRLYGDRTYHRREKWRVE